MQRFLLICLGGAVGTGARYLITIESADRLGTTFPWGTLFVNLAGSFLLGVIAHLALKNVLSADQRLIFGTGVMGGLTTYSTFNMETTRFFEDRAWWLFAVNVTATGLGCFVAGILGLSLARAWTGK